MAESKAKQQNNADNASRSDNSERREDIEARREADQTSDVTDLRDETDDQEYMIEGTEDAVTAMEARESRRDDTYRTGGDNYNPGVDLDIDYNGPKDSGMPRKKRGGSRGKSDWH
jgi:hypothetical protein